MSLSLILFLYGDDKSGLDYLIGPCALTAMLPNEPVEVYIVSTVLLIITHVSMCPHCLKAVIGGSYEHILNLRVLAVELVDINLVLDGAETLFTVHNCLESI